MAETQKTESATLPDDGRRRRRPLLRAALLLLGAAVLAAAVWGGTRLLAGGQDSPADGTLAASAYEPGQCFAGFDPDAASNREVPCEEAHSAQLVAVVSYAGDAPYPGKDALEERASQLCQATTLALPEDRGDLKQRKVFPTEQGWGQGDRRVDCFVESTKGDDLVASLLP